MLLYVEVSLSIDLRLTKITKKGYINEIDCLLPEFERKYRNVHVYVSNHELFEKLEDIYKRSSFIIDILLISFTFF
jgi:hypothetical protein